MKVLIDIGHPAHVNFFKNALDQLQRDGWEIKLTVLNRGKLPLIASDVFKDYNVQVINRHRGKKWSIIIEANIFKFFTLLRVCLKFKPDIGLSAGSFVLGAVLKILDKPNLQFDDDPERKANVFLEKITSTKLYFPMFFKRTLGKISRYNALKEWAYLSPNRYNPDINALNHYDLTFREYIFVREVSVGSLNYSNQKSNLIASVSNRFPVNVKVILSLEDKSSINQYPSEWVLLQEPVKDIHALIFYSKLLISSGDSMAREAAVMGVPSIYCGIRKMSANQELINKKMLFHKDIQDVPPLIEDILNKKVKIPEQEHFISQLKNEWIDVADFIVNEVLSYSKGK